MHNVASLSEYIDISDDILYQDVKRTAVTRTVVFEMFGGGFFPLHWKPAARRAAYTAPNCSLTTEYFNGFDYD